MCQDQSARMIIKRGSGVPTIPVSADHRNGDWIATDIYEGEFYQDTDTGLVYQNNGGIILMSDGRAKSTVWEALITQTGTNAPVLTVIQNDLGITATPTYSGVGGYTIGGFAGNLTGNLKIEKNMPTGLYNKYFALAILNINTLFLETGDTTATPENGLLTTGSYISITKY